MHRPNAIAESELESYHYFDVAVRKGWIKPTSQDRARLMCEKILVAATGVFARQGYHATKVADITSAAGCSVGIFYKRFTDKESLFYTLQYRHYEMSNRGLDRLVQVHESRHSTEEILRRFVDRTLNNMITESGFQKAMVELSLTDPRAGRARRAHHKYAGDRLLDFLAGRQELPLNAEMREKVHFAIRVVFATINNFVIFGPGPYPVRDERVVENLTEFLVGFLHEEQRRLRRR